MTWVCRIPNCPQYGVEQTAVDPKQAWTSHYARKHFRKPAHVVTTQKRSSWDDREEETWLDKM